MQVGRKVDVIESLFSFDGELGHEIVLVFEADVVDPAAADFVRLPSRDASGITAVWRRQGHAELELLPEAVRALAEE